MIDGCRPTVRSDLLVCSRHFNASKSAPQAQFSATTIHCLVTRFHRAMRAQRDVPRITASRRTPAQRFPMALITIKDLPQSDDLDREAMRSIMGGGPTSVRPVKFDQVERGSGRIVDYPPGFGHQGPISARSQRPG
jgi:hypothetical protein